MLALQREDTYRRRDATLRSDADATLAELREVASVVVRDIFEANWEGKVESEGARAEKLLPKLSAFFPGIELTTAELSGGDRAAAEAQAAAAAARALDGKLASLESLRAGLGVESARYLRLLQTDNLWKAHMKAMNFVKDFAGLKVYAQEDPLNVYREEGLKLYDDMQSALRRNTIYSFMMYEPKAGAAAE